MILRKSAAVHSFIKKDSILKCLKNVKYSNSSWMEPTGYVTDISIYNSIIKKIVPFKTIRNNIVSWYCCGPTVYDNAHIGNFCSYMRFDIIRRIMSNYFGLNVIMVMNITDIDDKIIAKANELKVDYKTVSETYEQEFMQDLKSLNIIQPSIKAKVTDHIPEIIEFIQKLIEEDFAYITPDGSVYFSLNKYKGYGKFQPLQEDSGKQDLKQNAQDFALWKSSKAEEPYWKSPWGNGRPGWHIECSAIACKFLGNQIDLHSGGIDLKFPHHENEEAQCCARHGLSQWVNYWLHSGHLYTKSNEKMSKSLRNTILVKDFLTTFTGNDLRTFCLLVPYRNNIEFRNETIENAVAINKRLTSFLSDLKSYLQNGQVQGSIDEVVLFQEVDRTQKAIRESLSNDFDTAQAMTKLLHLISTTNAMIQCSSGVGVQSSYQSLVAVFNLVQDTLLNLGYSFSSKDSLADDLLEDVIRSTVNFRNKIRETALEINKKDSQELLARKKILLNACDSVRDDFLKRGIELKDRGKSTTWNSIDCKRNFTVNEVKTS